MSVKIEVKTWALNAAKNVLRMLKKTATDAPQPPSKRAIQKPVGVTGDLICY